MALTCAYLIAMLTGGSLSENLLMPPQNGNDGDKPRKSRLGSAGVRTQRKKTEPGERAVPSDSKGHS
jgi:hypothetical protein